MRRYSDDALVTAVETSTSWRAVLRTLGTQTSTASVRARADVLGLSYTHFQGHRKWTDRELADAVMSARSWSQVADHLGLAGGSAATTLRGHACRLGLDVTHLASGRPAALPEHSLVPRLANLARVGPLLAAAWFELCGLSVSWPLEPARYDLVVWRSGRAERVQVKTSTSRRGATWQVALATRRKEVHTYGPEEVDQFFIIDGDLKQYLIPLEVVGGLKVINISAYQAFLLPQL